MIKPLDTTIICRCERIRGNNGIVELLFTNRPLNGKDQHEEHALFNLLVDRGTAEVGIVYEITIRPVNK